MFLLGHSTSLPIAKSRARQVLLILAISCFLVLFLLQTKGGSDLSKPRELVRPTIDDIRRAYDPILHGARLQELVKTRCVVTTPTREEALKNVRNWTLSRYVSYHNIVAFLEVYLNDSSKRYKAHDFGFSRFLEPFRPRMHINRSGYPEIDIHKTPFADETYDIVAGDQVVEHVLFPHAAVLELKRILKPGGILVLTTCAYNPLHGSNVYGDYWRFMPAGLKVLALPFEGGIKLCGGWGSKDAITSRVKYGLITQRETEEYNRILPDAASQNDEKNPFTTWIIAQK